MSEQNPFRSGEFKIQTDVRYIQDLSEFLYGEPRYTLTITTRYFKVRRKLARITPLLHRPRGRKLLHATPISRYMRIENVKIEQKS